MKAWVWEGTDNIRLDGHYPDPAAKPGWVVLKVRAAGVCSTDVSIVRGRFGAWNPPGVLCHEICGEVVELGVGAKGVKAGDRVVVETSVGCGICVKCRTGNKHLCPEAGEIGFPPFDGGYGGVLGFGNSNLGGSYNSSDNLLVRCNTSRPEQGFIDNFEAEGNS